MDAFDTDALLKEAIRQLSVKTQALKDSDGYTNLNGDRVKVVFFIPKNSFPKVFEELQEKMKFMPVEFTPMEMVGLWIQLQLGTDINNYKINDGTDDGVQLKIISV